MEGGGHYRKEEEEEVKTKLEETQEEIYASSDEQDAQKRDEEEGGTLITLPPLTPKVLNIDEESTMNCNGKVDGSSDWSGRGSRSRESSTSVSTSGAQFDELKDMIQSLTAGVQTSAAEAKREQSATTSATTIMGTDVKRVVTKVDVIEEEVGATKKLFEKTNLRVEQVEEAIQEHVKKIQQMEEDLANMKLEGQLNGLREEGKRWKMMLQKWIRDSGRHPSLPRMDGWIGIKRWKQ